MLLYAFSVYRRRISRYMYQNGQSGGGIISSVGNKGGWCWGKEAVPRVSIARDLVVLGVSSVSPRQGPFLFRDILSPGAAIFIVHAGLGSCDVL